MAKGKEGKEVRVWGNPFAEGEKAYSDGKRRRDNPHHYMSNDHEQWDDGWKEAEARDGN